MHCLKVFALICFLCRRRPTAHRMQRSRLEAKLQEFKSPLCKINFSGESCSEMHCDDLFLAHRGAASRQKFKSSSPYSCTIDFQENPAAKCMLMKFLLNWCIVLCDFRKLFALHGVGIDYTAQIRGYSGTLSCAFSEGFCLI